MPVRNHNTKIHRAARTLAALVLLAALAAPAGAARVTDVRVGLHPSFTRVVFETDAPTRYRIQRGPDGEIQIQLGASAMPRRISTRSELVSEVRVAPGGQGATARLRLRGQDVKVSELILLDPPRIVLDLRGTGSAVAKTTPKAAPKPAVKAQAEPAPKPAGKPTTIAKPAPEKSAAPAPEKQAAPKVAETAPNAGARETAAAEARAKLAEASRIAGEAAAAAQAKAGQLAEAGTAPGADPATAAAEQARKLAAEKAAAEKAVAEQRAAAEAAAKRKATQAAEASRRASERAGSIADKAREKAGAAQSADSSPLPAFLSDPVVLGGIGVAIALALGIFIHQRRSGREDDYLSPAAADDEPFSMDEGMSAAVAETEEFSPAAAAEPLAGVSDHETSHEDEEAAAVDTGMDTPMETTGFGAMPSGGVNADVMSMMQEMERRITGLEKRVEEVTEAKERLERQVAAQTEELRVQRSAIARTQRALRSIARPEDEATEPVPKT